MTPEGKIKKRVKEILDEYRHYRFMPVQTGMGARTLDFLVCINGKFLAIETKAPGKEMTMQQVSIGAHIVAAGGTIFKVDGSEDDYAELIEWLEKNA